MLINLSALTAVVLGVAGVLLGSGVASTALSISDGATWLPDPRTGGILQYNPSTGRVESSIPATDPGTPMSVVQGNRMLAFRNDTTGQIVTIDLSTMAPRGEINGLKPGMSRMMMTKGMMFVADLEHNTIVRVDPVRASDLGETWSPGSGRITDAAADEQGVVWTSTSDGIVKGLQWDTGRGRFKDKTSRRVENLHTQAALTGHPSGVTVIGTEAGVVAQVGTPKETYVQNNFLAGAHVPVAAPADLVPVTVPGTLFILESGQVRRVDTKAFDCAEPTDPTVYRDQIFVVCKGQSRVVQLNRSGQETAPPILTPGTADPKPVMDEGNLMLNVDGARKSIEVNPGGSREVERSAPRPDTPASPSTRPPVELLPPSPPSAGTSTSVVPSRSAAPVPPSASVPRVPPSASLPPVKPTDPGKRSSTPAVPVPSVPQAKGHRSSVPRSSAPVPSVPLPTPPRPTLPRPTLPRPTLPRPTLPRPTLPRPSASQLPTAPVPPLARPAPSTPAAPPATIGRLPSSPARTAQRSRPTLPSLPTVTRGPGRPPVSLEPVRPPVVIEPVRPPQISASTRPQVTIDQRATSVPIDPRNGARGPSSAATPSRANPTTRPSGWPWSDASASPGRERMSAVPSPGDSPKPRRTDATSAGPTLRGRGEPTPATDPTWTWTTRPDASETSWSTGPTRSSTRAPSSNPTPGVTAGSTAGSTAWPTAAPTTQQTGRPRATSSPDDTPAPAPTETSPTPRSAPTRSVPTGSVPTPSDPRLAGGPTTSARSSTPSPETTGSSSTTPAPRQSRMASTPPRTSTQPTTRTTSAPATTPHATQPSTRTTGDPTTAKTTPQPDPVVLRPTFAALEPRPEPIQATSKPRPAFLDAAEPVPAGPEVVYAAPDTVVAEVNEPGTVSVGWAYAGSVDHFEVSVAGQAIQVPGTLREVEVPAPPVGGAQSVSVAAVGPDRSSAVTEATVVLPAFEPPRVLTSLTTPDQPRRTG